MESGSIAEWILKEGDPFAAGDVFCSVETDKATVDFEAQDDGFVAKVLVQAGGGEIKVGEPIMITVEDEGAVGAFADYKLEPSRTAPVAAASEESPDSSAGAHAGAPSTLPPRSAPEAPVNSSASGSSAGGRVFASPLARMLAKEMGHEISSIAGTGPHGRVLAADVKEFVPSQALVSTVPSGQADTSVSLPTTGDGFTDYPVSEASREVASRLVQSKRNVPHYYLTVDICMDELLNVRKSLNENTDGSLGVYEMMIKAAANSMKAVPTVNASWMDTVVRVYDKVDINVVVGSGDSLYTPVIKDVAAKGLKSISSDLATFVDAIDPEIEGGEAPAVLGGLGTFTIMNLGMYGIKACAPIIREPQACALAIGALENRIVPNDDPESDDIYKESVMVTATLSCDHRVVDGAVGAQWLAAFKSYIESPSTLLL